MAKSNRKKRCDDCKSYTLYEMPDNIYSIVLDRQTELKKQRKKKELPKKSIEETIYSIINEWKLLKESRPAIVVKNEDDFTVLIKVNETIKSHIINALNIKMQQ